jgi:hypothetical protein
MLRSFAAITSILLCQPLESLAAKGVDADGRVDFKTGVNALKFAPRCASSSFGDIYFVCRPADFSSQTAAVDIAPLAFTEPSTFCNNTGGADYKGKVLVIDRGDCPFYTKAKLAEAAGAVGVLIANQDGRPDLISLQAEVRVVDPWFPPSGVVCCCLWWSGSLTFTCLFQGEARLSIPVVSILRSFANDAKNFTGNPTVNIAFEVHAATMLASATLPRRRNF